MSIRIVVKKNTYFDSVSLMSISTRANKLDGVEQAFVAMATEMNKGVLKNLGLLTPELEEAKSGDLMIVIKGASDEANAQTLVAIDDLFTHKEQGGQHEARYATLASAKKHGKPSGILAPVEADARRYLEWGATFVAVGSDLGVFRSATQKLADAFKK